MNTNVMVVDDDPSILFALRALLEPEGFDIVTAAGGAECLNEMAQGWSGLILMDIMMPEMDGWGAVRRIVDAGYLEGSIICMLTARDIDDQRSETLAPYVTDYITKPFEPEDLVTTVREYLALI
jgi:CheY-like chemotaxis protein